MTFNEYVETVKREIKDYLPEEYKDVLIQRAQQAEKAG